MPNIASPIRSFLLACLVLFYPFANWAEQDPHQMIKIGIIVPLSGDMAIHGLEIQKAMELALEKAQAKNLRNSYQLFFEDNQLNGLKSSSAAQKLINVDYVDAIVTLWPPTASVVLPLTESSGVLHYTIAWDSDLARKHKLLLSHQTMVSDIARATLRLLYQQGKRRVAFFHMEETGFNLGAKYIRDLAPSECIDLVSDESFDGQQNDFHSLIDRSTLKKPDAYLIWSVMPSMDLLIRQIRSRDLKVSISGYLDYAQDFKQIQGARYISEMYASSEFIESYKQKFGEVPISKGANAFDIMNLLIRAFESNPKHKLTGAQIKAVLTTTRELNGAVGTFSIDEFGNSSYAPVVRKIKGEERLLVTPDLGKGNCTQAVR